MEIPEFLLKLIIKGTPILGNPPVSAKISQCLTSMISISLQAARQLGASADLTVDLAAAVDTCPSFSGIFQAEQSDDVIHHVIRFNNVDSLKAQRRHLFQKC